MTAMRVGDRLQAAAVAAAADQPVVDRSACARSRPRRRLTPPYGARRGSARGRRRRRAAGRPCPRRRGRRRRGARPSRPRWRRSRSGPASRAACSSSARGLDPVPAGQDAVGVHERRWRRRRARRSPTPTPITCARVDPGLGERRGGELLREVEAAERVLVDVAGRPLVGDDRARRGRRRRCVRGGARSPARRRTPRSARARPAAAGGRSLRGRSSPSSSACCSTMPARSSSVSSAVTVARESPSARPSSARLRPGGAAAPAATERGCCAERWCSV